MLRKARIRAVAHRLDNVLYGAFAGAVTLVFARVFYGYMRTQTGGEWSAPLDDVFIHFDYARSIARGYPFHWSEGNGFSSGNTSLSYPFVLAAGYWAGFRGPLLVVWAGIVACLSMWAMLLSARLLFRDLAPWAKYLAPLATYSVGALGWSIFSGMEVAYYLGLWGLALGAMYAILREEDEARRPLRQWLLGATGVLLVLTRPEGATSIAVLGIGAAIALRGRGFKAAFATLFRTGTPSAVALVAQAVVNRWMTGESASNGAIAKLFIYNPFLTTEEKLDRYLDLLRYVVLRNVEHHFSDVPSYGWIVPALAALPLVSRRTRPAALLLWTSAISWLLLTALNGQARWQNERYTMPAVAWILLSAALGLGLLFSPWFQWKERNWPRLLSWAVCAVSGILLGSTFIEHQASRMKDQIWFFGRASRNIRDQQTTAGRLLRRLEPAPKRVLVGDAGAITYAADIPGLDLIGLGGYGKLPFARAGVHGLGASLELLERIAPEDRPDYFALYPSWWGNFPSWFGSYIVEVPVHGNVICGGAEKVIYRADWRGFDKQQLPRTLNGDERITDELDVADLLSEREHDYQFCIAQSGSRAGCGMTDARLLPDPFQPGRELFDAGRHIRSSEVERFRMSREVGSPARLILRTVGDRSVSVDVHIDGQSAGSFEVPVGGWQEVSLPLPETRATFVVELSPRNGDWVNHHVWLAQPR